MSNLQHAPGPWTYDSITMRVSDADGEVVCEIMRDNTTHDDGRVLAAAHDMLRLLRVLVDKQDGGLDEYWESQNTAIVSEARELIAKLDGGE